MQAPQLKRGPFGYTFKSVRLTLADRDARASEQARAAEALVLELRSGTETLRTELAEQAKELRALGAEAADLRTDRDATRGDLEGALADAARLELELTTTRRELETVRHDLETTRHEIDTARDELDRQDERRRAAEELSGTGSGEIAVLRQELGSARRYFLIQSHRARNAEARIEELEAELRSVRAELDVGLSAATAGLEAGHAAVEETAARPAADSPATPEEPSAVLEAAGRTMARIMDGARTRAAEELREVERARRETQAEIERLAAWRDRLAPLVGVVQSTIEGAKERAAGIGDRVGEAVAPLTEAVAALSDRLAAVAELAALPNEATREPASERSVNLIELHEQDGAPGQRDPAWRS
jgi:chromosome segregation ATPase